MSHFLLTDEKRIKKRGMLVEKTPLPSARQPLEQCDTGSTVPTVLGYKANGSEHKAEINTLCSLRQDPDPFARACRGTRPEEKAQTGIASVPARFSEVTTEAAERQPEQPTWLLMRLGCRTGSSSKPPHQFPVYKNISIHHAIGRGMQMGLDAAE